jgi:hypothetical protein
MQEFFSLSGQIFNFFFCLFCNDFRNSPEDDDKSEEEHDEELLREIERNLLTNITLCGIKGIEKGKFFFESLLYCILFSFNVKHLL